MSKNSPSIKQTTHTTLTKSKLLISAANKILAQKKKILKKKTLPIISKNQDRIIEFEDGVLAWIDKDTGLMWETKNKNNLFAVYPWGEGMRNYAQLLNKHKYAGFDDWRVPDIEELRTLLSSNKPVNGFYIKKPLANLTNTLYWSSTTSSINTSKAWYIDVGLNISGTQYKQGTGSFRCVRGSKIWWMKILIDWAYKHYLLYPGELGKRFPQKFKKCLEMETLDLEYSHLSRLPEKVENLINLKRLYLRGNSLKVLPVNIEKLINLTHLGLENNSLLRLPGQIGNLKKLENLMLCENNLQDLPEGITKLKNLKKLYLQDNEIKYLPRKNKTIKSSIWNKFSRFKKTKKQNKIIDWLIKLKKNGCEIIV